MLTRSSRTSYRKTRGAKAQGRPSHGLASDADAHHDFAEMRRRLQILKRARELFEWEHIIDDRPDLVQIERAVHFLEQGSRADQDAPDVDGAHQDVDRVH